MIGTIARPTFYEGEILPAADLGATVDYPRDQMARHARYAHSWGIVTGLELTSSPAANAAGQSYAMVAVSAGLAIDGTGREIIVPDKVQLDPTDFLSQVNPQTDNKILYPVFLTGLDQLAPASSNLTGACDSSQSTRTQENYNISYGAPGGELGVADQMAPVVTTGPDDGVTSSWKILLGFVTWDVAKSQTQFSGAADVNPITGVGRRYVGVNAAEVVSGSGSLLLATHPATFKGQNSIMAVRIQEARNDGQLVFGKLSPDGTIAPVLTVKSTGEVIATGQISGAVTPGSVQVQSGVASDGMTLPLPPGIHPADVAAGKITLHIHTSPRLDQLHPPPPPLPPVPDWEPFPYECHVDPNTRQVHCRLKWRDMTGKHPSQILPTLCDYTVIAAVAAS
jgi:hypothetical protein